MPHLATLQTISCNELVTATGGQWQPRLPQPGSPGSGPMTLFSLLDKPGRTLRTIWDFFGGGGTGNPGDTYVPARANPDGTVTPGRFDPPRAPGTPEVPMSQ